jgi:hypothetical protein
MKTKNVYVVQQIVNNLKKAYVSACKGLSLANKLKNGKAHKSRIMGRLNRIRAELKKYENKFNGFDITPYTGMVLNLLIKNGDTWDTSYRV